MQKFIAALAIAATGVNAGALGQRNDACCFHLTANGGPGGPVKQLSDGQNRIGQTNLGQAGQYCIDSNGGLTDGNGRGCILTPPTTQWQCDAAAKPTTGFSVGCDGTFAYQGNTKFWSCPTGDNGGYNIYTQAPAGQQGCAEIILTSDGCKSGCPPPPPPPPSSGCPMDLTGNWEFPHLIVPVDSSEPDTSMGTSYNGKVCGTVSSIYNFDIPASDAGKQCSLMFLLPTQDKLQTSSFTLSGTGSIDVVSLNQPAMIDTTFKGAPAVKQSFQGISLAPGSKYAISTFACPAGQRIAFSMAPQGSVCLDYFQDYNPCPIGLYITVSN